MRVLIIPDLQLRDGVPTEHLRPIGNYLVAKKPDVVVCLGDAWDMPSLSRFATSIEIEGQRIKADIDAGKRGIAEMLAPLKEHNIRCVANKKAQYKPRLVFTSGNHEPSVRIPRLISEFPILDGILVDDTKQFLESYGFEVYDFLEVVTIEGIRFSHYHVNPHSAKKNPLSGSMDTMLKNAGFSFVAGHTQGLKMAKHYLADGSVRLGIQCGSCYLHDEPYAGIQGNKHWRGIIMLNEVSDGSADICEISLNYLLKNWR